MSVNTNVLQKQQLISLSLSGGLTQTRQYDDSDKDIYSIIR